MGNETDKERAERLLGQNKRIAAELRKRTEWLNNYRKRLMSILDSSDSSDIKLKAIREVAKEMPEIVFLAKKR